MMDKITSYPKALYQEGREVFSIISGEAPDELEKMPSEYKVLKVARFALGVIGAVALISVIIYFCAVPLTFSFMTMSTIYGVIMMIAMAYISHKKFI